MRGARTASQLLHARHSSRLPGILAALRTKEQNEANSLLHGEGAAASLSFSAPRGAVYLSTSTISVGVSIAFCVLVLPSPRVYYSFCPISRSSRAFLSSPRPPPPRPSPPPPAPLRPEIAEIAPTQVWAARRGLGDGRSEATRRRGRSLN